MGSRTVVHLLTVLVSLAWARSVDAHDIWLLPERLVLERGDTLVVHLQVGHEFQSELELPIQKELVTRFELITPHGTVDLLSELVDRTMPVLKRKVDFEGLALLVMEHGFTSIELSSAKFAEHLKHEQLKEMEEHRHKRGPRPRERERYARTLTCLVRVGKQLEGRRITDVDLRYLKGMVDVKTLVLNDTQISDDGLLALVGLTELKWLDLSGTAVTDAGLVHLARLTGLRMLDLGNTQVTDAGLARLTHLRELQELRLNGTQVTDVGLAHIKGLGNLQTLDLGNTRVTDAGMAGFAGSDGVTILTDKRTETHARLPAMRLLWSKLEIRPVQNPYLLASGDDLDVRILFDAEPLPDQLVWAHNTDSTRRVTTLKARTNANGVARFRLKQKGLWQIRLVHLIPCSEWDNVDWQSYWASYTFKLE